jgi:hypothetical protein
MAPAKDKRYKVIVAGVGHGPAQVAIKGQVIELDADDATRLLALRAVEETDEELTAPVEEAVPVEHAQPQESQEEHAAKTRSKASK